MLHHHRRPARVHVFRGNRVSRHLAWGGALIAVGVAWLLEGQGLIGEQELWLVAPALVALSGLVRLAAAPNAAGVVRAIIRFAIAAYLVVVIEHLAGWTLAATWPVLLIAVGAGNIAHALAGHRRAQQEPNW